MEEPVQVTDSVHLYRVNGRRKVERVCSLRLSPTKAVNAKTQRGKDAVRHSRNQKDRIMAAQNHGDLPSLFLSLHDSVSVPGEAAMEPKSLRLGTFAPLRCRNGLLRLNGAMNRSLASSQRSESGPMRPITGKELCRRLNESGQERPKTGQ
jgi:hypothetical protein